jgi:K+/H+ antiporter YhaU regulatory subunit KhtT
MNEHVDLLNYHGERVLLNPSYDYRLKENDRIYVIGLKNY